MLMRVRKEPLLTPEMIAGFREIVANSHGVYSSRKICARLGVPQTSYWAWNAKNRGVRWAPPSSVSRSRDEIEHDASVQLVKALTAQRERWGFI